MASACVNSIGSSPETFLDCASSCPSYGWLSPRISFSCDEVDDGAEAAGQSSLPENAAIVAGLKGNDLIDFEFHLDDPVAMLPADELFSDGKLVPLQRAPIHLMSDTEAAPFGEIRTLRSPDAEAPIGSTPGTAATDQCVFSPKAPTCSSRWRELLGWKKIQSPKPDPHKSASGTGKSQNPRSLKCFLHRSAKSASMDSSLGLPLLRDSDPESLSISSRLSLSSSSSSGPDHEDRPRLSLDFEKPRWGTLPSVKNPPRIRISKPRITADAAVRAGRNQARRPAVRSGSAARMGRSPIRRRPESPEIPARGASLDSPRMNSSGKVVFQGLGRSSSSPSSFNGGPRNVKARGVDRSYSANVRITPVLNVPVCTLRRSTNGGLVFGLGQLFAPHKRDGGTGAGASGVRSARSRGQGDRILVDGRRPGDRFPLMGPGAGIVI